MSLDYGFGTMTATTLKCHSTGSEKLLAKLFFRNDSKRLSLTVDIYVTAWIFTTCIIINPIMVDRFAYFFNCMAVNRPSV